MLARRDVSTTWRRHRLKLTTLALAGFKLTIFSIRRLASAPSPALQVATASRPPQWAPWRQRHGL